MRRVLLRLLRSGVSVGAMGLSALMLCLLLAFALLDGRESQHPLWMLLARTALAQHAGIALDGGTLTVRAGVRHHRLEAHFRDNVLSADGLVAALPDTTLSLAFSPRWPLALADAQVTVKRPVVRLADKKNNTALSSPPALPSPDKLPLWWRLLLLTPLSQLAVQDGQFLHPLVQASGLTALFDRDAAHASLKAVLTSERGTIPLSLHTVTSDKNDALEAVVLRLKQGNLSLPLEWTGNPLPLSDVSGTARLTTADNTLTLESLVMRLGQATFNATGKAVLEGDAVRFSFLPGADVIPHSMLMRLWPKVAAGNVHKWLATNMQEGYCRKVQGTLAGIYSLSRQTMDWGTTAVKADLDGYTIRYFRNLPAIQKAQGTLDITMQRVKIVASGGEAAGIRIADGTVLIDGLDAHHPHLSIDAMLESSLGDALAFVQQPDLPYLKKEDIDPARTRGQATTRFTLSEPLSHGSGKQTKITASSTVQDATLTIPHWGKTFTGAALVVEVPDDYRVRVSGKGLLEGIPATVNWQMQDKGTSVFAARGQGEATQWQALLGHPLADYIEGAFPVDVKGTLSPGGSTRLDIRASLDAPRLSLPQLRWEKKAGKDGAFAATVLLQNGSLRAIEPFALTADNTRLGGTVRLQPGMDGQPQLQVLDMPAALLDNQPFSVSWNRPPSGNPLLEITLPWFDPRAYLKNLTTSDKPQNLPDLDVHARIGQLWMSDLHPLLNNTLHVSMGDGKLQGFDLSGSIRDKPYVLQATRDSDPTTGSGLRLLLSSKEGGRTLQALGLYDNMRKGTLEFRGFLPDGDFPLTGRLTLEKYKIKNAPVLASILSVASLTGPLDLLSGEGIRFDWLEANITYYKSVLTIRDSILRGQALGLQARGTIDALDDTVNLRGAVIPAYILTRIVGGIPLLGNILTNNNKEGLIAMRYTATGKPEDLSVSVNPLTALTPGFLRGFFDILEEAEEPASAGSVQ